MVFEGITRAQSGEFFNQLFRPSATLGTCGEETLNKIPHCVMNV